MKIAIIGCGYAGLSAAIKVLQLGAKVCLFQKPQQKDTASLASAGLLHPYVGYQARLSQDGHQAFNESCKLLTWADPDNTYHRNIVFYRVPKDSIQKRHFLTCAEQYPTTKWTKPFIKHCSLPESLAIEAIAVEPEPYLHSLLQHSLSMGAEVREKKIETLQELSNFDQIIIAAGCESELLWGEPLGIFPVRGQALLLQLPKGISLTHAIGCGKYLVPIDDGQYLIAGATFERNKKLTQEQLYQELIAPFLSLYPPIKDAKLIKVSEGVRMSTPSRYPLAIRLDKKHLFLGGFGSRGLLYHGLFSSKIASLALC